MKLKNLLLETPEFLDEIDVSKTYGNSVYNLKEYKRWSTKSSIKKIIKEIDSGISLVEIKKEDGFDVIFAALDNVEKKVCYVSKCKIETDENVDKYVYQSLVWVDTLYRARVGELASLMVFEQLLPKYKVIATDRLQTKKGMKYWARLINTATLNEDGKYIVYFLDTKKKELRLVDSFENLQDLQTKHKIWEKSETGMSKIMIISTKKLKMQLTKD